MTLLSRDAILKAQDVETKDVNMPSWGGTLRVRSMTVAERNEFIRRSSSDEKNQLAAWLVTQLAVDEKGGPVFKPEDIADLEKRSFKSLDAVVQAILQVNGMDDKAVDEAAKK